MDTKSELIIKCDRIVKEIENGEYDMEEHDRAEWGRPCAGHYLSNVPDIEYTVSRWGEYLGTKVYVSIGGPTIWISTRRKEVRGRWGDDYVERLYLVDALGLDDYLAEEFNCLLG